MFASELHTIASYKIQIDQSKIESLGKLVRDLEKQGIIVRRVYPELDLLIGDVSVDKLEIVRRMKGIVSIDPEDDIVPFTQGNIAV